jgi:tetratricopeptide (TPR) repeat protein
MTFDLAFDRTKNTVNDLINANKFKEAVNACWDYIDAHKKTPMEDPSLLHITYLLGIAYIKMGKFDLALQQLTKVTKVNPDYQQALHFLDLCKQKVGAPGQVKWGDIHGVNTEDKHLALEIKPIFVETKPEPVVEIPSEAEPEEEPHPILNTEDDESIDLDSQKFSSLMFQIQSRFGDLEHKLKNVTTQIEPGDSSDSSASFDSSVSSSAPAQLHAPPGVKPPPLPKPIATKKLEPSKSSKSPPSGPPKSSANSQFNIDDILGSTTSHKKVIPRELREQCTKLDLDPHMSIDDVDQKLDEVIFQIGNLDNLSEELSEAYFNGTITDDQFNAQDLELKKFQKKLDETLPVVRALKEFISK